MPANWRQRARWTVATVLLVVFAAGCRFTSIIYERLDWLVMTQVDHFFDLSWREEAEVKPVVKEWVAWVKEQQLAAVLAFAKDLQASSATPWTKAQLEAFWDRAAQARVAVLTHGAPQAAAFLKARRDEQWQHLREAFAEKDEKARAILEGSRAGYEAAYAKKILKPRLAFCETWFGDLREDQKKMLTEVWMEPPSLLQERLRMREAMRESFVGEAKTSSRQELEAKIIQWAKDPTLLLPLAMREDYRRQKDEAQMVLVRLSATLDGEQRQHFQAKLAGIISDLEAFRLKI